jgi:hypothetical protein
MATAVENLTSALESACARLAELDAVPVDTRARSEVNVGGILLSWNQYRASLLAEIEQLTEQIGKVRILTQGPFTVRSTVRG